jgi:hypothetical protein
MQEQRQTASDKRVLMQGGGRFKFKSKSGSNGSTKRFKRFPRGRGAGCETLLLSLWKFGLLDTAVAPWLMGW